MTNRRETQIATCLSKVQETDNIFLQNRMMTMSLSRASNASGDSTSSGSIGMGTNEPEAKLHVKNGDARIDGSLTANKGCSVLCTMAGIASPEDFDTKKKVQITFETPLEVGAKYSKR